LVRRSRGPLAARAQQPGKVYRVGVLMPFTQEDTEGQRRLALITAGLALIQGASRPS
jgi:hypothetical protein